MCVWSTFQYHESADAGSVKSRVVKGAECAFRVQLRQSTTKQGFQGSERQRTSKQGCGASQQGSQRQRMSNQGCGASQNTEAGSQHVKVRQIRVSSVLGSS